MPEASSYCGPQVRYTWSLRVPKTRDNLWLNQWGMVALAHEECFVRFETSSGRSLPCNLDKSLLAEAQFPH